MLRRDLSEIPAYVPGKKFPGALKLSSNEVAQPPLPSVVEAMKDAAETVNRYPDMGATELKEALAKHLDLETGQIAVGNGSSALCQQVVQIVAGPGDEIVFPWRSFEAYPIFAQVVGATPRAIPLTHTGAHDLDAMAEAINENTKLVFLCTPNNPSGTIITEEDFDDFMVKVPTNVLVVLDEAYTEYIRDDKAVKGTDAITRYPNVIAMRTFSKAYGLAGIRVGYAFGPEHIIQALDKVAIPFAVSSVAQAAAIASLNSADELLERTNETVAVRDQVADHIGCHHSHANFVWLPGANQAHIAEALQERGVIVRLFDDGVRITITTQEEADKFMKAWDSCGF